MALVDSSLLLILPHMRVISKTIYLTERESSPLLIPPFKAHFVKDRCKAQGKSPIEMETHTKAQLSIHSSMGMELIVIQMASRQSQNSSQISGSFIEGHLKSGKKIYPDGKIYKGELKGELEHGKGLLITKAGERYAGLWDHGLLVEEATDLAQYDFDKDPELS